MRDAARLLGKAQKPRERKAGRNPCPYFVSEYSYCNFNGTSWGRFIRLVFSDLKAFAGVHVDVEVARHQVGHVGRRHPRPRCLDRTDRIAEVVARSSCDAAVNIQGDGPLIDPAVIDLVAKALANAPMSTAAARIRDGEEYESPNIVKVVVNSAGRALYFSRRTIPFVRDAANTSVSEQLAAFPFLKHLGIYGYRRETLLRLVKFPVSPLEQAERLEQLRALENGIEIAVSIVGYDGIGVDTPADAARVERILQSKK